MARFGARRRESAAGMDVERMMDGCVVVVVVCCRLVGNREAREGVWAKNGETELS